MNDTFTYTILQYKHSLLLNEAINVGVLFSFPHYQHFSFVSGNSNRLKYIYPEFDQTILSRIIKNIETKIKEEGKSLFKFTSSRNDLKEYIHNHFLQEDATSLQFSDPVTVVDTFRDYKITIYKFAELLLPGIKTKKNEVLRHNESFIIKKYTNYIFENNKTLENRISRNRIVEYNDVKLKFDISWKNGTVNLVKPLSFDLKEEQDIQSKSATYFGYLTLLKGYADSNKCRFDLLVSPPQDKNLHKDYSKALNVLNDISAPKRIIEEGELKKYSEETIENLLKYDLGDE